MTTAALITGGLCVGLSVRAAPAYADVITNDYTIGTASGAVSGVVASPGSVVEGAPTNFEVAFTASGGLSGAADNFVLVQPSEALASVPTEIDIVAGSCIATGTAGAGGAGSATAQGLTIELGASCTIPAGTAVQVSFTAGAPSATGNFNFTVVTSTNSTPATSNTVTASTTVASLSAASHGFGADTTYTISGVPVENLTSGQNTLVLTSVITSGSAALSFYNGAAGYTVSYAPSGGTVALDPVATAMVSGNSVAISLEYALASGPTLTITALGANPPGVTSLEANAVDVQAGNARAQLTSSITFGTSVSDLTVSPSTTAAGTPATYTVGFRVSSPLAAGGDIVLSEVSGPTNFGTVTSVRMLDRARGQAYVAAAATLAQGTASVGLNDSVGAGDYVTLTLTGVTNSQTAVISDFEVSTTADPDPVAAAPYAVGLGTSAAAAVSVNPAITGAVARYTISNLWASGPMTAGTSTISIYGPSGTVFPNSPGYYDIQDLTAASGSGAIGTIVSGGGTSAVVVAVPKTIASGDVLAVNIDGVVNPTAASSTNTITLQGNVISLAAAPTTTTRPATNSGPRPTVAARTTIAEVAQRAATLELSCARAACAGTITLVDVRTKLGHAKYKLGAGKTGYVVVGLLRQAFGLLAAAHHHTITVTETVTVTGGITVARKIAVTTSS